VTVTGLALALTGALTAPSALPAAATEAADTTHLHRQLRSLVKENGFPAALAALRGADGRTRHLASGVADLGTGARVPVDGQVRAGSNTKTLTAVVVLQLVGEGKVDLAASIDSYLPGLVRGSGIDGRDISVRQLLQHTSGLPDYIEGLGGDFFDIRDTYYEPRDLLDLALAREAHFAPGERWEYSNTNYLLAGMLIQRVTGRPVAEEITRRVISPIGLRHTYMPAVGEKTLREPHPRGYHAGTPGTQLRDITGLDPSWAGAAGQLVSTPSDLNRFFSALLGGELLEPAQLRAMRTTVAAPGTWPGARYGLGLFSTPLTCGGLVWGHGGDIPGYETRGGVTGRGRAVTVAVTALPAALPEPQRAADAVLRFVDDALCS
jgi:D-alanyl-D-alanine carboxypeptidase